MVAGGVNSCGSGFVLRREMEEVKKCDGFTHYTGCKCHEAMRTEAYNQLKETARSAYMLLTDLYGTADLDSIELRAIETAMAELEPLVK